MTTKAKPPRWRPWASRPTLRVTLTTVFLTLILLTVAALGLSSARSARFTADDLSDQVLDGNSRLVDAQINHLLRAGSEHCRLSLRLMETGQYGVADPSEGPRDFSGLARYWLEVMRVHPRLTRMQVGLEDGDWFYVHSSLKGDMTLGEFRHDPGSPGMGRFAEYRESGYPARPVSSRPREMKDIDPRERPWYVAARDQGRTTWVESYNLLGSENVVEAPGVTYAAPIVDPDGLFLGVVSASFDVAELSVYLRGLRVGEGGAAFVVEARREGGYRLIAHPDPRILVREVDDDGRTRRELVPIGELADRRIPSSLTWLAEESRLSDHLGTGRVRLVDAGVPYLGAFRRLSSREAPEWLIGIIVPEAEILSRVDRSNRDARLIGLAVVIAAIAASLAISLQVARPLERVARETEAIGRLSLAASPVAHSIVLEVERLAVAVEETKTSLRSFGKYVPGDLLRLLVATGQEATLGGERRRMTVSFCDLADFTGLAEGLDPEDLVRHLGDYFERMAAEVTRTGGTVDKFIGDAIMAFWGAPVASADHATAACLAALRSRATMARLRDRWLAEGKPPLFARIGVQSGEVIVGNIGSPDRLNYTVMGDPVNVASRLEGLNKLYRTDILIGDSTHRDAAPTILARPVDRVGVKGKAEAITVHEPLALRSDATPDQFRIADLAAQGLEAYARRDWPAAIATFDEIRRLKPDDGPATLLLDRCRAFRETPPPEDWDGVHRVATK